MITIAASLNGNTEDPFHGFPIRDKLGNGVIALNAEKKQLLFLAKESQTDSCLIIDLDNLNGCSVTKEYHSIKAGDLKKNKLGRFLKNIFLNLRSKNGPVTLPVYNVQQDVHTDVPLLESKVKKWQSIVSKFLKEKTHKTNI